MKIDSRFKNVLEPEFDVVAIVCNGYDLLRTAVSQDISVTDAERESQLLAVEAVGNRDQGKPFYGEVAATDSW